MAVGTGTQPRNLERYEVSQEHKPTRRSQLDGSVSLKISGYGDGERGIGKRFIRNSGSPR